MEVEVIGPVQALKEGWALFRRHPVVLLSGFIVFLFLLIMCVKLPIPYLNWALLATVTFPLLGGLHIMFLNAARDANPRLDDLFSGFRQFIKWFATGWTFISVFNVFFTPCVVLLFVLAWLLAYCPQSSMALPRETYRVLLCRLALILATIPAFALFTGYVFTLFAATDITGVSQSCARSHELVKGRRLRLLLTLMTLGLMCPGVLLIIGYIVLQTNANAFGRPGWVVFALGVAVATVFTLCAVTTTYMRLDLLTPSRRDSQISSSVV